MAIVNTVLNRAFQGAVWATSKKAVAAFRVSAFATALVLLIQPVVAQSAMEEASDVACSGALGEAVFLGFGLLTLVLILVGLGQIGMGFLRIGRSGGGMSRRDQRGGITDGFLTLLGGLFLGSMGALLDYLGIDVSGCLQGGEILIIMPQLI